MVNDLRDIVFSKNTVEFVTIAKEYCAFTEKANELNAEDFINKSLKLLSLLYLKAALLPETEQINEEGNEKFVTEFDWQYIRHGIENLLGDDDFYLDFFDSEMNETPEPVSSSISENLADIYQDLKDFMEIYQLNKDELSNDAVYECSHNFWESWGFKLINSLKILHLLNYKGLNTERQETPKGKVIRDTDKWFISRAQKDFQSNE